MIGQYVCSSIWFNFELWCLSVSRADGYSTLVFGCLTMQVVVVASNLCGARVGKMSGRLSLDERAGFIPRQ